jgi:hypothetical protein
MGYWRCSVFFAPSNRADGDLGITDSDRLRWMGDLEPLSEAGVRASGDGEQEFFTVGGSSEEFRNSNGVGEDSPDILSSVAARSSTRPSVSLLGWSSGIGKLYLLVS